MNRERVPNSVYAPTPFATPPAPELAGRQIVCCGPRTPHGTVVVLLHGFAMLPMDLAPFAAAAADGSATFVFPEGPLDVIPGALGRDERTATWWAVDAAARAAAMARGPRDLSEHFPVGVEHARAHLDALVQVIRREFAPKLFILGGFSQGAMLSLEWQLHADTPADALVLMSGARIRTTVWQPLLPRVKGLPVYQAHGRDDPDLSFSSAERLCDLLQENGASVAFNPFDGGHETPLRVWRGLKKFIANCS